MLPVRPKDTERAKQIRDLTRGALFIADRHGPQSARVNARDLMMSAIENHLSNHTYYDQRDNQPNAENRRRIDTEGMRKKMQRLFEKATPAAKKSHSDSNKSQAETFFRLGSSCLPAEVLKYYGYDKDTTESDLPGYEEIHVSMTTDVPTTTDKPMPVDEDPEPNSHMQRSIYHAILGITASSADGPSHKYSTK